MALRESQRKMREKQKKKKREKEQKAEEDEEEVLRDPLEVFGTDIMLKILCNLDARSVALSLVVSRGWHSVASSDRLWSSKCEELWLGKAHIPRLSHIRGLSKLGAYSLSVMDSKRTRIMKDDLCDHVWEFHFNKKQHQFMTQLAEAYTVVSIFRNSKSYTKAAPEYWLNLDPYWRGGGPLMRRYFHPDGSQTADPGDKVWGGHESCFSIVTSFVGERTMREHYVRINRWPRMFVFRKQDWSWGMYNHLCSYSSIPDANKEGGTGPLF